MTTKLTLSISDIIREKARRIAKIEGMSISKMFEEYILFKSRNYESTKNKRMELVEKLSGVLGHAPKNFNYKKEYAERINKKYFSNE